MSTLLLIGIVLIVVGMTDIVLVPILRKKNPVVGIILLVSSLLSMAVGLVLIILNYI